MEIPVKPNLTCPADGEVGGAVEISATLSPAVPGGPIDFARRDPSGGAFGDRVNADADGVYRYAFSPNAVGDWVVTANHPDDGVYAEAFATCTVHITEAKAGKAG